MLLCYKTINVPHSVENRLYCGYMGASEMCIGTVNENWVPCLLAEQETELCFVLGKGCSN